MKIGYSTTVIEFGLDISGLLERAEVIELCGYGTQDWSDLRRSLADYGGSVGLHCPLPYEGLLKYFDITSPHGDRREEAFSHVEKTLSAAQEIGASYVNVHFPTVLRKPSVEDKGEANRRAYIEAAMESASHLAQLGARAKTPVFLENVGPNPYFYLAEHYAQVFEAFPSLGMCLDFGHVHALPGYEDVVTFTKGVAPWVRSVHVYNTTAQDYRVGYHHPPMATQSADDGWMDLVRLMAILRAQGGPQYTIFEFSQPEAEHLDEVENAVQSLIREWNRPCDHFGL